jgi:hypothetical protein
MTVPCSVRAQGAQRHRPRPVEVPDWNFTRRAATTPAWPSRHSQARVGSGLSTSDCAPHVKQPWQARSRPGYLFQPGWPARAGGGPASSVGNSPFDRLSTPGNAPSGRSRGIARRDRFRCRPAAVETPNSRCRPETPRRTESLTWSSEAPFSWSHILAQLRRSIGNRRRRPDSVVGRRRAEPPLLDKYFPLEIDEKTGEQADVLPRALPSGESPTDGDPDRPDCRAQATRQHERLLILPLVGSYNGRYAKDTGIRCHCQDPDAPPCPY